MDGSRYFRVIIVILFLPQAEGCQDTCVPVGVAYKHIIPDSSFTATSYYDYKYVPENARLHNAGAWETETEASNPNEYLQVDLGKVLSICALATQGNPKNAQEWVTEYKISTSIDNKTWTLYPSNSSPKLFPGNTDKHSVVKNTLDSPVQAKLIRFIPTQKHTWKCLRVEVYESKVTDCQDAPLGISLSDSSFTASSKSSADYAAKGARLHIASAWKPNGNNDNTDYLQIDLGNVFFICALATQGNAKSPSAQEWVTEYKISTSIDNNLWTVYPSSSSPKLFQGNTDNNTVVKNVLDSPVQTKLIRFIPTKEHNHKALRVEVYGLHIDVHQVCQDVPVGVSYKDIIPDSSFTASSELRTEYGAKGARLYSTGTWEPNGNKDPDDYLQVDLRKVFYICALATQGNAKSAQEWTTEYKISTSIDNNLWTVYPSNSSPKLFPGNTDKDTVVKNTLDSPVQAKLIRFIPTKWSSYKAFRLEVYGLDVQVFSCRSLSVGVAKISDNSMTSSSKYNTSTPPSNGRLGYTAGSSWCSAVSDSSPHLRISLGSPYIICGVATQGDHNTDQWVQTYQIQQSTDGSTFTDYKQNNLVKTFSGNYDSNTVVHNVLNDGTIGQSIGIKPKTNYGSTSCMRTELYGVQQNTVCSKMAVGLSYSLLIPDHRFTASSYYDERFVPSNGRLITSSEAWEPKTQVVGDWLQIDLGSVVYLCAVATKGNGLKAVEYTKKYNLRVSLDNNVWDYYQENNADKVFIGNIDKDNIVTNTLTVPVKAKFIRFYPIEYKAFGALRVEVYGIPLACTAPFGLEKHGIIQDKQMASSSDLDSAHTASHGRLYGDASWCSKTSSNTEYIQINLGKIVTLTAIATQGYNTTDNWVESYTLKYSIDGNLWTTYNAPKVIQSNSDNNTIVVKQLSLPITTRHVRVLPQTWNTAICMRIELYGCTCSSSPNIKELSNQNLSTSTNSQVELVCKVQDVLIQYIEWYSDGADITNLSGGLIRGADFAKSVLKVNYTTADDIFNNYHCLKGSASVTCRKPFICRVKYNKQNSPADGIKGAEVKVTLDYPSALLSLSLDDISVDSVKVKWTKPVLKTSQLKILSYVIQYNISSGTKTVNESAPATSSTIGGLIGCTYYSVKIKPVSKLGDGPWSNTVTFRTLSALPKVPPGNVQAKAQTSSSILVTWQVPFGIRCPADGYKVIYSLTSGGGGEEVTVDGGHVTSHNITNLNKWTVYYIRVKIHNDQGDGPASIAVVVRTLEDAPSASPGDFKATVLNSTSVKLSWSLPPRNQQNGIIRGFRVWYKKTTDSSALPKIQISGNSTLQYVVDKLGMYTEYSFKVLAYTNKDGPHSTAIKRTHEGPPSAPRNVQTSVIKPRGSKGPQIQLTWDKPANSNGFIRGYNVSYSKVEDSNAIHINMDSATLKTVLPVCGGEKYSVVVYAYTVIGGESVTKTVTVDTYAPTTIPDKLVSTSHNVTTFRVSWQPVVSNNGPILLYEVQAKPKDNSALQKIFNTSCDQVACVGSSVGHECHGYLHNLPQCTVYSVQVRAYTSVGAGPFSEPMTLATSAPGPPRDLTITSVGIDEASLKWKEPKPLAKPVVKYIIYFTGKKSYSCTCTGFIGHGYKVAKSESLTVTGLLHADTEYTFRVSAVTECGRGKNSTTARTKTPIGVPPTPTPPSPTEIVGSVANITLLRFSDINGPIKAYQVIVNKVQESSRKRRSIDDDKLTGYEEAQNDRILYYIAAELNPKGFPRSFIVGDGKKGKEYGNYKNAELEEGNKYEVYQRALTTKLQPSGKIFIASGKVPDKGKGSSIEGGNGPTWIGPVVGVICLVAIAVVVVVVVVVWRRRRSDGRSPKANTLNDDLNLNNLGESQDTKPSTQATSRGMEMHNNAGFIHNAGNDDADLYGNAEAIRHQPIAVNKFNQYVNDKKTNAEFFKEEFKLLSSAQLSPWKVARDPVNKPRNRYANIITYDHSRIILQDSSNDYVNASFLHAFDETPRAYIATQGPTPATEEDFWQVVWQENIKTIVMLTNLVEAGKVKCHQYWPDTKQQYRRVTVNLHRSDVLADYVIRTFILTKEGEKESRQVSHFQYISWPDKGVPQHATSVLGFRRKLRSQHASSASNAPLLVHCSAGVGRTGAFIAVDAMLERVKKEKLVDIFNYVQLMRNNRISMVQTEEQYAFIHFAVQEALTCGNTEVPVLNLNIIMSKLSKPRPKDNLTGYEVEWKRLNAISPIVTEATSKAGRLKDNMSRNRYQNIVPFDSARVFLSQEHQNYINASFGNAYRERNAFIMAQAPKDNTIADFWHMIYQYRVGSIVTLNILQENNETFSQYWPSQGTQTYSDITIEVVSTGTKGPLVTRECIITHSSEPNSPQNVLHIQHSGWPREGAPNDCQSVLDIVDEVQKSQQKCGNAPIVAQCSDGVGRSGTFCAVYSLLERVKSEQVIDVFQAIKVLRLGRPNAVTSLEQYQFCYKMVQKYLDSFNDYANFSDV